MILNHWHGCIEIDLTTEHYGNGFVAGGWRILTTDSWPSFIEYNAHPKTVNLLFNQLSSHILGETAVSGGSSDHWGQT